MYSCAISFCTKTVDLRSIYASVMWYLTPKCVRVLTLRLGSLLISFRKAAKISRLKTSRMLLITTVLKLNLLLILSLLTVVVCVVHDYSGIGS